MQLPWYLRLFSIERSAWTSNENEDKNIFMGAKRQNEQKRIFLIESSSGESGFIFDCTKSLKGT